MRILWALALVSLCAGAASAATVYLTDGSVLKGTIQSADQSGIELSTTNGMLHIAASQISQVDYSGNEPRLWPPGAQEATPQPSAPVAPQYQPAPEEQQSPEYQPTPPGSGYVPYRRRWYRYYQPEEEEENFHQELTLDLGGAGPLNNIDLTSIGYGTGSNGAPGVLAGFQYLYDTTPQLGLGFTFDYIGRSDAYSDTLIPDAITDTYGNTEAFLGTLRYIFVKTGAARPYISFGLGIANNSTIINAHPAYGYTWGDGSYGERQLVNDDAWVPAASIKVGLNLLVWGPYTTSIEVGWTGLASSSYAATPDGENLVGIGKVSGPLNFVTGGIRWGWKF